MGKANDEIGRLRSYLHKHFPSVMRQGMNTIDEVMKIMDLSLFFLTREVRLKEALSDWDMINAVSEQTKYRLKHTLFKKRAKIVQRKKGKSFRECLREESGRRYEALGKVPIEDEIVGMLDELKKK